MHDSPQKSETLTFLQFYGPGFADHGIEVDVLQEIIIYTRLLQETAKQLWRREHPSRQRLPKRFQKSIGLKFFQIIPGSAIVPLVRDSHSRYGMLEDELVHAAQ